jgi:hypothetical protein
VDFGSEQGFLDSFMLSQIQQKGAETLRDSLAFFKLTLGKARISQALKTFSFCTGYRFTYHSYLGSKDGPV